MGARSADLIARACDLGVAMQLTNIARDVGEDARAGRLYLPRAWLREAGVDPVEWLATPRFRPEIAAVVARLLKHAEGLYARADAGIAGLDPSHFALPSSPRGISTQTLESGSNKMDSTRFRSARTFPLGARLSLSRARSPGRLDRQEPC